MEKPKKQGFTLIELLVVIAIIAGHSAHAEDWPEWRGKDRKGVWNDVGTLDTFPVDGLKVIWESPINNGFFPRKSNLEKP